VATVAVLVALLTGGGIVWLAAASAAHVVGAGVYVACVWISLTIPAAIVAQTVVGLVLVGSLLVAAGGPDPLTLAPLVAGVVATAELLGVAFRMNAPIERAPAGDLARAGANTVAAVAVFGLVSLASALPGPRGIVAIGLASAACAALAVVLVRSASPR
jgi:hypothetical protein